MREHSVPCVNATQFETRQNKHLTWNDDQICSRCVRLQDLFAIRRDIISRFDEDDMLTNSYLDPTTIE